MVAGPHFLADGKSLFKGVYDLSIRSSAARCIYKFTNAPIRAEISVTSPDGSTQDIATETLSERDGWLHLGAYNFHFSSPTVKVKLIQDAPKTNPIKPTSKVICTKGKVKTQFTGTKCPSGYRKA